jgi:hypothetical protein
MCDRQAFRAGATPGACVPNYKMLASRENQDYTLKYRRILGILALYGLQNLRRR